MRKFIKTIEHNIIKVITQKFSRSFILQLSFSLFEDLNLSPAKCVKSSFFIRTSFFKVQNILNFKYPIIIRIDNIKDILHSVKQTCKLNFLNSLILVNFNNILVKTINIFFLDSPTFFLKKFNSFLLIVITFTNGLHLKIVTKGYDLN